LLLEKRKRGSGRHWEDENKRRKKIRKGEEGDPHVKMDARRA
jgi:hypothetical protein